MHFTIISFFIISSFIFFGINNAFSETRQAEADFSGSIKVGPQIGLNMSSLTENGDGIGCSPEISVRTDLSIFKYLGFFLNAGYTQSRLPVKGGEINSFFINLSFLCALKYHFGNDDNNGFDSVYLPAGIYMNKLISSYFKDEVDGEEYNFESYYEPLTYGVSIGLGVEYIISGVELFAEGLWSRLLVNSVKPVESNVAFIQESSEYSYHFSIGAKFKICRFSGKRTKKIY